MVEQASETRSLPAEVARVAASGATPPVKDASTDPNVTADYPQVETQPMRVGRFEIKRWLGEGSFADVYLAYDPKLNREVALKLAKPGTLATPRRVQRFLREARNVGGLRHPNIVPLHEADEDRGKYFLVYAYIPGRTLAAVIDAATVCGNRLPLREATRIVRKLAEALASAHGKGIIHRDVKPSNVIIDQNGEPLLMDFGLAIQTDAEDGDERLTHGGVVVGTPAYMSPEQATGNQTTAIGPAADQYSIGCTLFELLTGRTPFLGSSDVQLRQHRNEAPPSPRKFRPEIPRDLEVICYKCLEKAPADRFASMQELADDLERWETGVPIRSRRLSVATRLSRMMRRHKVKLAAATLLLLAACGALAAGWYFDPQRVAERALAAGEPVTLLAARGWPKWHHWHLGDAQPAESITGDGAAGFQTHTTSALVLLRDPMTDRYRFTAELRHCKAHAENSSIGLFVGMTDLPPDSRSRATHWVLLHYSDFFSEAELKRPEWQPNHALAAVDVVTIRDPADIEVPRSEIKVHYFQPTSTPPNKWRKLIVDVSPDEVVLSWGNADEPTKEILRLPAGELNAFARDHRELTISRRPDYAVPPPRFNPRGALGIYACDSAIAFRNVSVTPIPPQP